MSASSSAPSDPNVAAPPTDLPAVLQAKIRSLHSSLEASRGRNEAVQAKCDVFARTVEKLEAELRQVKGKEMSGRAYEKLYRTEKANTLKLEKDLRERKAEDESSIHLLKTFRIASEKFREDTDVRIEELKLDIAELRSENAILKKTDEKTRRPHLARLEASHREETKLLHAEIDNLRQRLLLFSSDPSTPPTQDSSSATVASSSTAGASSSSSSSNPARTPSARPKSTSFGTGGLPSPEDDPDATLVDAADEEETAESSVSGASKKRKVAASSPLPSEVHDIPPVPMTDFQRSIRWCLQNFRPDPHPAHPPLPLAPSYAAYVASSGPPHPSAFHPGPQPLTHATSLYPPYMPNEARWQYFMSAVSQAFPGRVRIDWVAGLGGALEPCAWGLAKS